MDEVTWSTMTKNKMKQKNVTDDNDDDDDDKVITTSAKKTQQMACIKK